MLNPWVLLGIALVWAASVAGAYFKGAEHAENKARAHYATQLEQTIAEHNADALLDMEAAREWGQRNAAVRTKTVEIRSQANEATSASPAPAMCALDDDRWRVLNAAIEAGNDAGEAAAKRVLDATSKANAAGKPLR